jgi:hypothetical protein
MYDGNQTSLCFKCLACGEAFVLHYSIDILDEEVVNDLASSIAFDEPFDPYPHRVPEERKKNGSHLP